jgi:hypothetical protein
MAAGQWGPELPGELLSLCSVDQDPAHDLCGQGIEMSGVGPLNTACIDQPEECLVDERGGLQRVLFALIPHASACDEFQFPMEKRGIKNRSR